MKNTQKTSGKTETKSVGVAETQNEAIISCLNKFVIGTNPIVFSLVKSAKTLLITAEKLRQQSDIDAESVVCSCCGKECLLENECWVCQDKDCVVHQEEC